MLSDSVIWSLTAIVLLAAVVLTVFAYRGDPRIGQWRRALATFCSGPVFLAVLLNLSYSFATPIWRLDGVLATASSTPIHDEAETIHTLDAALQFTHWLPLVLVVVAAFHMSEYVPRILADRQTRREAAAGPSHVVG